MYSTYEFYLDNGGSLTETEYKASAAKAADKIDYYTFGRAFSAPEIMIDKIKRCECAVADILHTASRRPLGIASEGNDGVNVSYSQNAQEELEIEIYNTCRTYLSFPVNLMYAGRQ